MVPPLTYQFSATAEPLVINLYNALIVATVLHQLNSL